MSEFSVTSIGVFGFVYAYCNINVDALHGAVIKDNNGKCYRLNIVNGNMVRVIPSTVANYNKIEIRCMINVIIHALNTRGQLGITFCT